MRKRQNESNFFRQLKSDQIYGQHQLNERTTVSAKKSKWKLTNEKERNEPQTIQNQHLHFNEKEKDRRYVACLYTFTYGSSNDNNNECNQPSKKKREKRTNKMASNPFVGGKTALRNKIRNKLKLDVDASATAISTTI